MIEQIIYALLAILGLGFLVFIHELGHYWVARRKGMRVEVFSIGLGKPLLSWKASDGVRWQVGWLPIGGYVKIAGMQREGNEEPSEIPDGFYGKPPASRIWVALAGPIVNIVFACLVFSMLWLSGGREKTFSEFTRRIGWVDPQSALYQKGVRPGDLIERYDGRPFHGFRDLLIASIQSADTTRIEGVKYDLETDTKTSFDYTLKNYEDPRSGKDKLQTIGVLSPAQYLIYDGSPLGDGSPMAGSGIRPGDRIVWVDGELVYSAKQLSAIVNESSALLTVQRGDDIFVTRTPRIRLDELKLSPIDRSEIDDWRHEANLKERLQDLYFVPYNLSPNAVVEGSFQFIDDSDAAKAFAPCERCGASTRLQEGDQIIAVDGTPLQTAYDFLSKLQQRHVVVIVERSDRRAVSWTHADQEFGAINASDLSVIVSSIGTDTQLPGSGHLWLLKPASPKTLLDLPLQPELRKQVTDELQLRKKEIEKIYDPQKKSAAERAFAKEKERLVLGVTLIDGQVVYNPSPLKLFAQVIEDTWRTLAGLVTGSLSAKYVSGPVGIIHVVHNSWSVGAKEGLFWLAVISLNLGFINLLPIPVLDGGHIFFSLLESITKRPLKARTMERLVIPFVGLLVGLFIYITYQDLVRLFSKFF
ncbi:MAG: putative zinc metalloprotease [Chlamydiota bacterium]|jgi:regulator of sigma E protease